MATNIFEMFGQIGAKDEASKVIDNVVGKAQKADRTLSKGLDSIGSTISGVGSKLTKFITAPAIGATTALGGIAMKKGWDRLTGIDDARAKLKGLGHDAGSVDEIMDSALLSVRGTAFGMAEAVTTAANATAAGVEQGDELTKYLKTTADAAAIAGTSMGEMGSIINKVKTANRAYTNELNQLSDRGLPIYQWLAKEANVSADAVRDMASAGEISSEMFMKAIETNIGGAAEIMGKSSIKSTLANIGASLGRIGANFLDINSKGGGFFSTIKPLLADMLKKMDTLEAKASEWGVKFGEAFNKVIEKVKEVKAQFDKLSPEAQSTLLKTLGSLAVGTVALGPVTKVFGDYLQKLSPIAKGFENLNFVIDKVPGVMSGAFGKGKSALDGFGNKATSVFSKGKTEVGKFQDALKQIGSGSGELFSKLIPDSVQDKVGNGLAKISNLFSGWSGSLKDRLSGTLDVLDGLGLKLMDKVPFIETFGNKILEIPEKFGKVSPMLGQIGSGAQTILSQGSSVVTGIVGQTTNGLMSVVGLALKMIGPGVIIGAVLAGLGLVKQLFGPQLDQIIDVAKTKGPEIIGKLSEGIKSKLPTLVEDGATLLAGFGDALVANMPAIFELGITLITSLIEGVTNSIPILIPVAIDIIEGLLNGLILALPQLLIAGLDLLQGLIDGIVQNLPKLAETAESVITNLGASLTTNLPVIIEKGINILVSLIDGIVKTIPKLIPIVVQLISVIANAVMSNLPTIIEGGIKILNSLINGVVQIIPQLIPMVVQIITTILTAILQNLPKILEMGIKLLGQLVAGIIKALPEITSAALKIFPAIWDAIKSVDWLSIGADIIRGIASGIGNAAGALWDAAKSALGSFTDKVKGFFGIHSPSTLFRDEVGRFLPQGIAVGITEDAHTMQDALTKAADELSFDPDLGINDLDNIQFTTQQNQDINRNTAKENIFSKPSDDRPVEIIFKFSDEILGRLVAKLSDLQGREIDIQSIF